MVAILVARAGMTWCFYAGPGGVSVAQRRHATCPDLTREERHTAATSPRW